jgi:hypothetical protein
MMMVIDSSALEEFQKFGHGPALEDASENGQR